LSIPCALQARGEVLTGCPACGFESRKRLRRTQLAAVAPCLADLNPQYNSSHCITACCLLPAACCCCRRAALPPACCLLSLLPAAPAPQLGSREREEEGEDGPHTCCYWHCYCCCATAFNPAPAPAPAPPRR
jgi:hypothetical protein